MAQRRYGPTRGAGVAIIELEGEKPITPGALGFAGHAGIYEKGPTNSLNVMLSKTAFLRRFGSYFKDSLAPDAAIDFFNVAAGAGGLCIVRVTDGNELPAEATLYARNASTRTPMGTLKAKNGGRWGGKEAKYTDDLAASGDLTEITLTTGVVTWKVDQWKGGYVELEAVPNKRYPIVGNTAAGVVTVAADQTMKTDWGSGPSLRYYFYVENDEKALSYRIRDGEENPTSEFALDIYVDGNRVSQYPDLNTDPESSRYWVNVINNDGANEEVEAVDLWTGAHVASVRPANHYGLINTVTATLLTAIIHEFAINSPGGGNPTMALGTTTDAMVSQKITLTMTSPTAFDAASDKFGDLGSGTLGVAFTPNNKWAPPFTVTAGVSPLVATDTLVITYKPFKADSLIGGKVYPDKVNARRTFFRIVDNSHKTITAADGSDMTADGAPGDEFLVEAPLEMEGGRDGHSAITDAHYNQQAWDTDYSPYNQLIGKNMGLIKLATPGVTATAVQKAGIAYAAAKNYQYRYEVPANVTTEQGVDEYINDTLGRNDFAVTAFPSFGYVSDPEGGGEGKLKLVSLTGQIHGREARTAVDYDGYHKAAAGVEAILPSVLKLPTGDTVLNEEYLNPIGIAVIKKVKGNFIIWGDRTLHLDPTWRWKHQREMMSYYEHVLQEAFDWIVFAINDPVTEKLALAALRSFFEPEWRKRALRGDKFEDACLLKIDAENNTNATRAAGDMNATIKLRLADTVERFVISIGKMGIFDAAA